MSSGVVVLVPRRDGDEHREAAWSYVRRRLADDVPDFRVYAGDHDDGGPFNRSAAINAAAAQAGDAWKVAVILDSDTIAGADQLRRTVNEAARTGRLTFGYTNYRKLSAKGTELVVNGYAGSWEPYVKLTLTDANSGLVAVRRDLWDAVGGFDEGFVGWGWEDIGFSISCHALAGRRRIAGDIWHLWHPVSPERDETSPTFIANRERAARYRAVKGDAAGIRALLEELRNE